MKQLMVVNIHEDGKKHFSLDRVILSLKAQLDNSFELGWKKEDIIIVSNKDLSMFNVKKHIVELNDHCFTGSKLFGVKYIFDNDLDDNDIVWSHDLDVFQNIQFDPIKIKDMAISTYSSPTKLNGGSIFWRKEAKDILEIILKEIKEEDKREEPAINKILNSGKYSERFMVLNTTYNIGCSGFVPRMLSAEKPIRCIHMNPFNRISFETHKLDRDGCRLVSISPRLETLLRKYFPLANELSDKGKIRQKELREYHRSRMSRYPNGLEYLKDNPMVDNGNYSLNKKLAEVEEKPVLLTNCCEKCFYGEYFDKIVICRRYPETREKGKLDWCGEFRIKID